MYRRYLYSLVIVMTCVFISCKKENRTVVPPVTNPTPSPDPAPPTVDGVFLKDIAVPHLPSPYYHFEYDPSGKAIKVSFASDFRRYDVLYDGEKLIEMRNNGGNTDKLQYAYDDSGRVNIVSYAHADNSTFRIAHLSYDIRKLKKVEWQLNLNGSFQPERTVTLTYLADGNLSQMADQRFQLGNQTAGTYTDTFEDYDDKINQDGFSVLHQDFFDDVLLLPEVEFQKNNARKVTRTGDGNNYIVQYTYTYNSKNVPTVQSGDLVFTNGTDNGKHFNVGSSYSYY